MRRRLPALLLVLAAVLLAAVATLWPPDPDHPATVSPQALDAALALQELPISAAETDVILAVTCTLRRDRLEPYGAARPTSPFLRRLSESGVTFDSHIAQAPWTRPSIGSILTGRYPRVLRLDDPNRTAEFDLILSEDFTTIAEALSEADYKTIGAVGNPNAKRKFGLGQGFDVYDEPDETFHSGIKSAMPRGNDLVDFVLDELRRTPADQRIFAQIIFVDTHIPLQHSLRDLMLWPRLWTSRRQLRIDRYDAAVRRLDGVLARLLTGIREIRPNSLFIQVADHGEGLNLPRHHRDLHGATLYQSAVGIPHIWQHPALPAAGRHIKHNTRNIDVLPSILDLLGLSQSGVSDWEVDGLSYAAALWDPHHRIPQRLAFTETFYLDHSKRALLDGRWHFIHDRQTGRKELYRQDDVEAQTNLHRKHWAVSQRMQEKLNAWEAELQPLVDQRTEERAEVDEETRQMLEVMGYVE